MSWLTIAIMAVMTLLVAGIGVLAYIIDCGDCEGDMPPVTAGRSDKHTGPEQ